MKKVLALAVLLAGVEAGWADPVALIDHKLTASKFDLVLRHAMNMGERGLEITTAEKAHEMMLPSIFQPEVPITLPSRASVALYHPQMGDAVYKKSFMRGMKLRVWQLDQPVYYFEGNIIGHFAMPARKSGMVVPNFLGATLGEWRTVGSFTMENVNPHLAFFHQKSRSFYQTFAQHAINGFAELITSLPKKLKTK